MLFCLKMMKIITHGSRVATSSLSSFWSMSSKIKIKMEGLLWIWHVKCLKNLGYDSFSEFVVVAKSEEQARNVHPIGDASHWNERDSTWIKKDEKDMLKVTCVGLCTNSHFTEGQVIVASFHAG